MYYKTDYPFAKMDASDSKRKDISVAEKLHVAFPEGKIHLLIGTFNTIYMT